MKLKQKCQKRFLSIFFSMILIFSMTVPVYGATVNGFNYIAGDVLVTTSTSSKGLTGHAGIVHPNGKDIIHIAGPGYKPSVISIKSWLSQYKSTKVVRHKNKTISYKAANWALNYYINGTGKNTSYRITINPKDRTYVYCSELVWQSYYYGANFTFKTPYINPQGTISSYIIPNTIVPYHFTNAYAQKYNNFQTVKSIN